MKIIASFRVIGINPTPWTVPTSNRYGGAFRTKKSAIHAGIASLDDYKATVADEAQKAMVLAGTEATDGPVRLRLAFQCQTSNRELWGTLWTAAVKWSEKKEQWVKAGGHGYAGRNNPDLTNLVKATEDGLEGVCFRNDVQVRMQESVMVFAPSPGVRVQVSLIEADEIAGYRLTW